MTIPREQRLRRTFGWGTIYASDADNLDIGDLDFDRSRPVWSSPAGFAVATVHAGAVDPADADVELLIRVLSEPLPAAQYSAMIDVPSGTLNIGDADASEDIALHPGRWQAQIDVDDPEEPARVEIHLSPA